MRRLAGAFRVDCLAFNPLPGFIQFLRDLLRYFEPDTRFKIAGELNSVGLHSHDVHLSNVCLLVLFSQFHEPGPAKLAEGVLEHVDYVK